MQPRAFVIATIAILGGCAAPGGPYPSLQPRAGESLDPRLPVMRPMNDRPVTPSLASRLAALLAQAQDGDAAFGPAIAEAQRLADGAGPAQGENWIAAQEALTAAIAARGPTSAALGDVDAMAGSTLQAQQGLAPADLAAIKSAGASIGAIDQRQVEQIKALQDRLGR